MPPRKDEPERWRTEAGASSASGGHVAPEVHAQEPFYDPLRAPISAQHERVARSSPLEELEDRAPTERRERTEVIPTSPLRAPESEYAEPITRGRPARRTRPAVRRVRRTLKHVDPLSVLKVSLIYYACFFVLWLIFVAVVYTLLSSFGVFDGLEELWEGFVLPGELDISLMFVEKWAFFAGLVFFVVACLVNMFLAFLYNVAADIVGGVEMTFVDREL